MSITEIKEKIKTFNLKRKEEVLLLFDKSPEEALEELIRRTARTAQLSRALELYREYLQLTPSKEQILEEKINNELMEVCNEKSVVTIAFISSKAVKPPKADMVLTYSRQSYKNIHRHVANLNTMRLGKAKKYVILGDEFTRMIRIPYAPISAALQQLLLCKTVQLGHKEFRGIDGANIIQSNAWAQTLKTRAKAMLQGYLRPRDQLLSNPPKFLQEKAKTEKWDKETLQKEHQKYLIKTAISRLPESFGLMALAIGSYNVSDVTSALISEIGTVELKITLTDLNDYKNVKNKNIYELIIQSIKQRYKEFGLTIEPHGDFTLMQQWITSGQSFAKTKYDAETNAIKSLVAIGYTEEEAKKIVEAKTKNN